MCNVTAIAPGLIAAYKLKRPAGGEKQALAEGWAGQYQGILPSGAGGRSQAGSGVWSSLKLPPPLLRNQRVIA